jgi:DNA-binding NtrC family response regulator
MTRGLNQELIGESQQMQDLREEIARVSRTDAKVLITGESGVGKELVARAIHAQSRRSAGSFVAMNCAGVTETLLESELFGHVKGSFTGAYRDKAGTLELADRGTVFLDEIGEMTLRMQGLLLRFLESGEVQKVGSDRSNGFVNVRVIAATNRDLRSLIAEQKFRPDLFYRLNVIHLVVPPLRARRPDIPLLLDHAMRRYAGHLPRVAPGAAVLRDDGSSAPNSVVAFRPADDVRARRWSAEAMAALVEYSWPGNVRELENTVERIMVHSRHEVVGLEDLPPEICGTRHAAAPPRRERRRSITDDLYRRLREDKESFWTAVYPLYMQRDLTRDHVRDLVRKGLEEGRGNYRIVARLFNMEPVAYKRFLNFLHKHECHLPFKEYRQ